MTTVLTEQINIGPRLRRDMGDIKALAMSIQAEGLLEPIVISDNY